jgi:glycosyltransferase involved in cell wall biosynthesis
MSDPRVLVVHNRYRHSGGEERAVEIHLAALRDAGVEHRAIVRESAAVRAPRAAVGLLRGGEAPGEVGDAVRSLGATVAHFHNMQPLFGPRALEAARSAGARVVLGLHNYRLFCAIGVSFRFGEPCFRCHHGRTLPGLALNCRRSLPEAAIYAIALARQLEPVLGHVDRFVAPSRYAAGQLARLGVPADRIEPLPHPLAASEIAAGSRADSGGFALAVGRLAPEKGYEQAIEAAALAGVPLTIAGEGPERERLRELAARLGAPVEFAGRVGEPELARLRGDAAVALVPSLSDETFGLSALEAMGAGLPVVASRTGALPELVGVERCVPRGDAGALAARLGELWHDPERRRVEGDELIARVRDSYSEERFTARLLDLYARVGAA